MSSIDRTHLLRGAVIGAALVLGGCDKENDRSDEVDDDGSEGAAFEANPSFFDLDGETLGIGAMENHEIAKQIPTTLTGTSDALLVAPTADYFLSEDTTTFEDNQFYCGLAVAVTNVSAEPQCQIAVGELRLLSDSGELLHADSDEAKFFGSLGEPSGFIEQCLAPNETGWAMFVELGPFLDCMRVKSVSIGRATSVAEAGAPSVAPVVATSYEVTEDNQISVSFENTHNERISFGIYAAFLNETGNAIGLTWFAETTTLGAGETTFVTEHLFDYPMGQSNRVRILVDTTTNY